MEADSGKPEPIEKDPEMVVRLLDLQLKQKRNEWKDASARHRSVRMASYVSLFFLIMAALIAFVFLFSRANEDRPAQQKPTTSDSPDR
jgi:hypothetical protein